MAGRFVILTRTKRRGSVSAYRSETDKRSSIIPAEKPHSKPNRRKSAPTALTIRPPFPQGSPKSTVNVNSATSVGSFRKSHEVEPPRRQDAKEEGRNVRGGGNRQWVRFAFLMSWSIPVNGGKPTSTKTTIYKPSSSFFSWPLGVLAVHNCSLIIRRCCALLIRNAQRQNPNHRRRLDINF